MTAAKQQRAAWSTQLGWLLLPCLQLLFDLQTFLLMNLQGISSDDRILAASLHRPVWHTYCGATMEGLHAFWRLCRRDPEPVAGNLEAHASCLLVTRQPQSQLVS